MGALLVCWLAFPFVMSALALGCGLLVERAGGARVPGVLLAPVGFAAIIVIAGFFTLSDATAEFATPAVVIAAIAGLATAAGDRERIRSFDRWGAAAGVGVFVIF